MQFQIGTAPRIEVTPPSVVADVSDLYNVTDNENPMTHSASPKDWVCLSRAQMFVLGLCLLVILTVSLCVFVCVFRRLLRRV